MRSFLPDNKLDWTMLVVALLYFAACLILSFSDDKIAFWVFGMVLSVTIILMQAAINRLEWRHKQLVEMIKTDD